MKKKKNYTYIICTYNFNILLEKKKKKKKIIHI